ncbi:FMN-dependent NADH-azoreductase [Rhodobacterales bacterium]|nr:FMN-dependent NADH-azoreductase [Rhodobacterales bacterium]
MTTILHLDSSILGPYSVSRELSAEIVARQTELHPGASVVHRDLVEDDARHLSGTHLAAWQGDDAAGNAIEGDLKIGDAYISELFAADIIVIGAPMYNFTVSSQLKAWIDRVVVAGKTFKYTESGPESLLPAGKKVFIASTRGGVYTGDSPAAALEHHESYLLSVLGFIGLSDVTIIRAEGVALGDEPKAAAIADAKATVHALTA